MVVDPRPIGIVDSGVGGLTVARAVFDLLPGEPILYVGDNGRFPYGPRRLEEIRRASEDRAPAFDQAEEDLVTLAEVQRLAQVRA